VRRLALALMLAALVPSLAFAATPQAGSPSLARLQGPFLLAGRVTVANNVSGERVGQNVLRTWTFTSSCRTGECATVSMVRPRAGGTDSLVLHLRAPGYYVGQGSFSAPLRCGNQTYRNGEAVPFTITVRVTAAVVVGGVDAATRVGASYANRSRTNRTPCVAVLGHDAATYHGHLVLSSPPTGGTPPSGGAPL
jgi:hypothetical protein